MNDPLTSAVVNGNKMVTFDSLRQTVTVGDRVIRLTPTEYRLLWTLSRASGVSVSRLELAACALGDSTLGKSVPPYIKKIRRKLGAKAVVTTKGGYMLGNFWDMVTSLRKEEETDG